MKVKKLICLLLCACAAFTVACKKNADDPDKDQDIPGDVTLASFDSYEDGLQLMRVLDKFGAISLNEDPTYATSGKSAKIQPLGGYISTAVPICYYPFRSELFDFDYRDVSYLKSVEVDIYNAEEKDIRMTMGLVSEVKNTDLISKCNNPLKVTLKPGKNTVTYSVDTSILGILCNIKEMQGVYFMFDRVGSREIEDAPVLYMDNLVLHYTERENPPSLGISLDENEILSFDESWQKYVVAFDCENIACEPTAEIVKLSSLGITAASGGQKALKVSFPAGSTAWGSWNRLVIPEIVMQTCDMPALSEDDYADTYFCIDFYGLGGEGMTFYPEFFDTGYGSCDNKWSRDIVEGDWVTLSVPLSEIDKYKVQHPGFFRLAWAEFTGDDTEVVIDNIRLEKR